MVQSDFTVRVHNLPPEVTTAELKSFFSYCGTVDKILPDPVKRSALVTFRQPYAHQTALLLDGAMLGGRYVRIRIPENTTEGEEEEFEVQAACERPNTRQGAKEDAKKAGYEISAYGRALMDSTLSAARQFFTEKDAKGTNNVFVKTVVGYLSPSPDKPSKNVASP